MRLTNEGYLFAAINGPAGHRTGTVLVDGRIRCECKRVFGDRTQLTAHHRLIQLGGDA